MPLIKCEHCGTEFHRPPSHAAISKYCSRSCYAGAMRIQSVVVCETCGVEFDKKPSQIARSKHNYCSPSCAWKAARKREIKHCEWCGKQLERIPAWQNNRHFCSKRCAGHGTQGIGPESRQWKGGRRVLQRDRSKAWARDVKERAGYVCEVCGAIENLHAHHIASFAENPNLRYDVSNGICVCESCHWAFHHRNKTQMVLPLEAMACA